MRFRIDYGWLCRSLKIRFRIKRKVLSWFSEPFWPCRSRSCPCLGGPFRSGSSLVGHTWTCSLLAGSGCEDEDVRSFRSTTTRLTALLPAPCAYKESQRGKGIGVRCRFLGQTGNHQNRDKNKSSPRCVGNHSHLPFLAPRRFPCRSQ